MTEKGEVMKTYKAYVPLAVFYVGLVVAANWLASAYIVHVPLTPYLAPAGVFAIGAILVLRDWLQQLYGLAVVMPLVYAAGLISFGIGDMAGWTKLEKVAVASIIAFSVSETVEALIFTPVRKRSLTLGVALSGTVGLFIDSLIFLSIAFGSLAFLWGQVWGKAEMLLVGVVLTALRRRWAPVQRLA